MNINLTDDGVLHFPSGEPTVPQEFMTGSEEITELILPDGVLFIGAAAFAECTKLRRVEFPSTLKAINYGAFLACSSLTQIRFPEGLEEIQETAFWGCDLKRVVIPESVRFVGEHAFWENENLRHADVLNPDARLEKDVFGSCYHLTEGYIAPGYPPDEVVDSSRFCQAERGAGNLLYTLLWCSCPERHSAETTARAEAFIRENQDLVMEWILRENNVAAMTTIAKRHLLDTDRVDRYVKQALEKNCPELIALLLQDKGQARTEDEFDL
ncbi:MAG: leucine-rich repeat domain-containing protein [Clostridia bacterium]|nr:leucine-rich repeat domain-containing protein [Clostridia bacterium]